jgi:maltooligosyltrehalose trehalohydrolase
MSLVQTFDPSTIDADLGACVDGDSVRFLVWAPRQQTVSLHLDGHEPVVMEAAASGYFFAQVRAARAGQRYRFQIAEGLRPDPVSRFQPDGPSGASMVVDPRAFSWTDREWPGALPGHRQVVYELHIGTFTVAGTWAAAGERLSSLARLGITTIEVMPIAEFAGRFGWGYDGVFLFAPFHEYGAPDDVRRFVDEAHRLGLAVILDVVFNHVGPVGSVLNDFSDWYFSDHETEWGSGFNVDGAHSAAVRQFMRAAVRHWIREYHVDGLRFDATHTITDRSPEHIVNEMTRCVRAAAKPRRAYVVAENERQDVSLLKGGDLDGGGIDALWNEDWHHAAFVSLVGQSHAYFTDYEGTANEFAAMARWGFLYQGQWYSWQQQERGTDARRFPGPAFVCFLENHDQVANTGRGLRLYQLSNPAHWRAMVTLLLLGPGTPMLFQGQECRTEAPFRYFADHEGPLAEDVRAGRLKFLSQFPPLADPATQAVLPDPADEHAYRACKIDWKDTADGRASWALHHDLLEIRRSDSVLSRLGTGDIQAASSAPTSTVVLLRYATDDAERMVVVNLAQRVRLRMNDPLLAPPQGQRWAVTWCSERAAYGGAGAGDPFTGGPWTLQAHCAWVLQPEPADHDQIHR